MSEFPSVLPPNTSIHQKIFEQVFMSMLADWPVDHIRNVHNPKLCRADFLPWLAWEWSVDEWDNAWTVSIQRDVVWNSPRIHHYGGTVGAIKDALKAMGYGNAIIHEFRDQAVFDGLAFDMGAEFSEPMRWFEYGITLDQPISAEMPPNIHKRLGTVAADRSVLIYLDTSVISTVFDGVAFDAGHTFDEIYKFNEAENVN